MSKSESKKSVQINVPSVQPWEGRRELRQKEDWLHQQQTIHADWDRRAAAYPKTVTAYLRGLTEITAFMLKNTCGIGSNFKLAECDVRSMPPAAVESFYKLTLTHLAYHLKQVKPREGGKVWHAVAELIGDPDQVNAWETDLAACVDAEQQQFSPVRAGRKLWEQASRILNVPGADKNATARIYYQTAPGQNVLFLAENHGSKS